MADYPLLEKATGIARTLIEDQTRLEEESKVAEKGWREASAKADELSNASVGTYNSEKASQARSAAYDLQRLHSAAANKLYAAEHEIHLFETFLRWLEARRDLRRPDAVTLGLRLMAQIDQETHNASEAYLSEGRS